MAASRGHADCVRVLLEFGADISREENNGVTPVCAAVMLGHKAVIRALYERDADVIHVLIKDAI